MLAWSLPPVFASGSWPHDESIGQMPLTPGTRLGPYEVSAPIGAGGMGEVYRARDTRLGRDVAVKVLPSHLSSSAEVRARFEREARTISSLNHPHICTLHDVGREGETDYLVMELVQGETLAERLTRGALPVAEVLKIGAQIADALERAHRAGVVHRDLKPGNVMLTRSGAKLMDFGLARPSGLSGPSGSGLSAMTQSPTVAQPLTAEGTIVGTFQYMSPEQLDGKESDARSDLWALGCVLYEMATGKRPFQGATQASLISAIMRDTPRPMTALDPMSPPALERLVGALLAKDPDERIQTAHDARLQLEWAAAEPGSSAMSSAALAGDRTLRRTRRGGAAIAWGVAAVSLAAAVAMWFLAPGRGTREAGGRLRLTIQAPPGNTVSGASTASALSPDGRTLAVVATDADGTGRLWLRNLGDLTTRVLAGTEHADQPFWSPDSRWIAFFAEGKLKRIALSGGIPEAICDAPDPRGGAWGARDVIVFASIAAGPLFSVAADGGAVTELVRPDSLRKETALRFPEFLPDGRQFLFVSLPGQNGEYDVHVGQIGSHERRQVLRAGAAPVYTEPGYLITTHGARLTAQRFDARTATPSGKPIALGEAPLPLTHIGAKAVSASRNGLLSYWSGSLCNTQLQWLDRSGRVQEVLPLPSGRWEQIVISPEGSRAVVTRGSAEADLWLVELATGQSSRFTFRPSSRVDASIWSPDGSRVAFEDDPKGRRDIFVKSVNGGETELLYESDVLFKNLYSWSPDGMFIAFEQPDPRTGWDAWVLPLDGDRKPVPVVRTPANEGGGWFSPDGRWIVYSSDESGRPELYVQAFPEPFGRVPLDGSATSGTFGAGPCWWSRDGREILFRARSSLRVVAVEPGQTFRAGPARELFQLPEDVVGMCPTPDLQRLLVSVPVQGTAAPALVIDMNWASELREP